MGELTKLSFYEANKGGSGEGKGEELADRSSPWRCKGIWQPSLRSSLTCIRSPFSRLSIT